jgi:hypothetical protein
MDLEDRLRYCKLCHNKTFNFDKGMLCGLTNEKPQFDETCSDYKENMYERKIYEENLRTERIKVNVSFDANSYATNNRLISVAAKYIPQQMKIRQIDWRHYMIPPIILIVLMVIVANLKFEYSYRLAVILFWAVVAVIVSFKNLKSLIKDAITIALIDDQGIILKGEAKILWDHVLLVYVNTNLKERYLMLEILGKKTPIRLQINKTLGPLFILTITEAYRQKLKHNERDV